jgi:hypothetical protein
MYEETRKRLANEFEDRRGHDKIFLEAYVALIIV